MTANIIGGVLFVLAIAVLYAAPICSVRRDARFWRGLRELDSTPILRKEGDKSRNSHLGIEFAEPSFGADIYGRAVHAASGAALRPGGGSNHSTEGTP